ncbi:MAG: hypothetical protein BRC44_13990 [Cyanobacteria bacterium QS_4_48_99]|nr:MAG: hypothetical protein BRC44_13990 [Cyanobacteria bacterium QS_4_48_99]
MSIKPRLHHRALSISTAVALSAAGILGSATSPVVAQRQQPQRGQYEYKYGFGCNQPSGQNQEIMASPLPRQDVQCLAGQNPAGGNDESALSQVTSPVLEVAR